MAEGDYDYAHYNDTLPAISEDTSAFTHIPEHGFSLFMANRTKIIHFIRHAEGTHNAVNQAYGDDTPVTFSTEGAWDHIDARLTPNGISQCAKLRDEKAPEIETSELVVVSPFTRTLQTAHIIFGGQKKPFLVHHLCQERTGKYTCDKRRTKSEIVADMKPIYDATNDVVDFDSFGYPNEGDVHWREKREPSSITTRRGIEFMKWLASRPEKDIAVVTHSSWLKHLFRAFGEAQSDRDKKRLHKLSVNAEVRSICLACHKGFYPPGEWVGDTDVFVPEHKSFRQGKWAPTTEQVADLHRPHSDAARKSAARRASATEDKK